MRNRTVSYALIFIFVISFATVGLSYGGVAINERNELNRVQNNISSTEREYAQGRRQAQELLNQIQTLEQQMVATQAEIDAIRGNIEATQGKIREAQAELYRLENYLAEQNKALNARLRAMYMNGNIGVIDVLLGSNSISNFMTNMDRVQLIFESDAAVIQNLEAQHEILAQQRQHLEDLEEELTADRDREASKRAALARNQEQVAERRGEVVQSNQQLAQQIDALNAEANRLIEEIFRLQSDSAFVGGAMLWPVPGVTRVTSEFGYRHHPILGRRAFHSGIDIAAPTGTRVVAANAGRVIMSGWNNSLGFMIVIDHGGGISTLYGHHSENLVREGDFVTAGQQIARVGSTGMSTGPHLHFEVRRNGVHENPRNHF